MTPWAAHLPPGLAVSDVDLLGAGSLPRSWRARWEAEPSAAVLHTDQTGWLRAGDLDERTRRAAGRLRTAGVTAGDRVLLCTDTSLDLVVVHVAALRLGAVVVPANPTYRDRELRHLLDDAAPVVAVLGDPARAERWRAEDRPGLVVTDPQLALPDGEPGPLDQADAHDPALLAYTSGTTGTPKGALLSHGNLLASAEALRVAWRWTPEDRLVLALPLFHLHGLGVGLHGTLHAGAAAVLRPRFDAFEVADQVAEHRASLFFGVPTMWARLVDAPNAHLLRSLRLGVSGSAPLDAVLHQRIAEVTGQSVIERYGMTETVMNVSNPYDGQRRPGTVGLPLPGVEVALAAETQEIMLRGPNVFAGYWRRDAATSEACRDGWFATGDVGSHDSDGYLRIIGRRKELIISGGYNVYPREVEDVLRAHPAVGDVAVVGEPDATWGERVVAVLEGTERTAEAHLRDLAARELAPYKQPKRYAFVRALPRNALGKVVRSEILVDA
jgi:malonyl-CoA/methylmalonyl-CoA synthetase